MATPVGITPAGSDDAPWVPVIAGCTCCVAIQDRQKLLVAAWMAAPRADVSKATPLGVMCEKARWQPM